MPFHSPTGECHARVDVNVFDSSAAICAGALYGLVEGFATLS